MADRSHDIEKYLRGELSSSEMHALEREALNDPFLADALEGMESISSSDFTDDIRQVRAAVQKRVEGENGKIVPLWPLVGRIAAGVLVVIVSGYIVTSLLSDNEHHDELALNKSTLPKPAPAPEESRPKTAPGVEPTVTEKRDAEPRDHSILKDETANKEYRHSAPLVPGEDVSAPEALKEEAVLDRELIATNENVALDSVVVQKDVTLSAPTVEEKFEAEERRQKKAARTDGYVAGAVQRSAVAKTEYKKPPAMIVHGTVTDENNEPLPGVNVMIKGSDKGVITGIDGTYQIPLDDANAELVFSFIGMNPVDVPVASKDAINVKMEEDISQLSEVVVVGYTSAQESIDEEKEPNIYQLAEPEGGRKAFKKYLVDNMRYPEQAIENKIQGKVTIQFTIQQSGVLNDFKVVKGLGYGCDEEVIRLIRQGPKWTPTRRNAEPLKGKVKVRLRFQLPH